MNRSAWGLLPWDRTDSPYRSTAECAAFLGKVHADGALDAREARVFLDRAGVQKFKVGGSVRYRRADIESIVRPVGRRLRRAG